MHSPNILIVEDEAELLQDLSDMLSYEGHVVTTAGDAETALAIIAESRPDLVLCDIRLPGMSGLDLLRALQDRAMTAAPPRFIFLTAYGDQDMRAACDALGALDCLQKPVDYARLTTLIDSYLAPGRATSASAAPPPPATAAPSPSSLRCEEGARAVLIVEDDSSLAEEMIDLLDCYDIPAVSSTSVGEALARLRADARLVGALVDLGLGAESGFDLIHAVAQDPALASRRLRFVILSGATCDPDELASLPIAPIGILLKPAPTGELMQKIRALIATD